MENGKLECSAGKSIVVSCEHLEGLWRSTVMTPSFLTSATDEGKRQLQALAAFTPGKLIPIPIQYEVGWAQRLVWTFWCSHTIFYPYQESNHDSSVVPPVGQSPHRLNYPGFCADGRLDFKE